MRSSFRLIFYIFFALYSQKDAAGCPAASLYTVKLCTFPIFRFSQISGSGSQIPLVEAEVMQVPVVAPCHVSRYADAVVDIELERNIEGGEAVAGIPFLLLQLFEVGHLLVLGDGLVQLLDQFAEGLGCREDCIVGLAGQRIEADGCAECGVTGVQQVILTGDIVVLAGVGGVLAFNSHADSCQVRGNGIDEVLGGLVIVVVQNDEGIALER